MCQGRFRDFDSFLCTSSTFSPNLSVLYIPGCLYRQKALAAPMSQDYTNPLEVRTADEEEEVLVNQVTKTGPRPDLSVFSMMYHEPDEEQDFGPFQRRAESSTTEVGEKPWSGWDGGVATLTEPRTIIEVPSVVATNAGRCSQ